MNPADVVSARTLRLGDVTPAEAERWADLVDRALEPNPFLSPAYLLSASRWLARTAGIVLLVVGLNLLGDGLRDALDPKEGNR